MKLREEIKLINRDFKLFFKRKRENKFDYIFSLGYNCEVAFRLYEFFKFEESCLFHWTYAPSCDDLIFALKNFELIGKNGYETPNPLWECKNTHIRFHGKADMTLYLNGEVSAEIMEKDRKDLEVGYYFYEDLVGCSIIDQSKNELGIVNKVEEFPAQITLRVKRQNGKDFFVPFVKQFIKKVDIDAKKIYIEVIEGML